MTHERRILFLSSNGTGLGHLTRSMAIARRLDPSLEPLFFTLSGRGARGRRPGLRGRVRRVVRDADGRQRLALVATSARPPSRGDARCRPARPGLRRRPSLPGAHRRDAFGPGRPPGLVPAADVEAGLQLRRARADALLRPGAGAGRVRGLRGPRSHRSPTGRRPLRRPRSSSATTRSCTSAGTPSASSGSSRAA